MIFHVVASVYRLVKIETRLSSLMNFGTANGFWRAFWPPLSSLGYSCSWAILFWTKHAPNSRLIALKIVKWIITWKKLDFADHDLVEDVKSVAGFSQSFLPILSRTEWRDINTAWLPRQFQNGSLRNPSFETNFLRKVGTSEAETSVSGKAECLLAFGIGKDKNISFLEWPFPLREKSGKSLNSWESTVYLQVSLYSYLSQCL